MRIVSANCCSNASGFTHTNVVLETDDAIFIVDYPRRAALSDLDLNDPLFRNLAPVPAENIYPLLPSNCTMHHID